MITNQVIATELNRIASKHGGNLRPADVVEEARPVRSPLHTHFDWDESEAAHRWRLHQARMLIRVVVEYQHINHKRRATRVFVSLTPDRRTNGGYRTTVAVLSNSQMRAQMLRDALNEMQIFESKYSFLRELAEVFQVIRKVRKSARRGGSKPAGRRAEKSR